ncbi:MAG: PQQ-binding-like beta-propeller repeat protein [Verrucomicrobium sp.]
MSILRYLALGVFVISCQGRAWAGDWPQFLGPTRQGIASDGEVVAQSFPSSGPKFRWKASVGTGFAGPVVYDNKVVIFHRVDDQALVQCLDGATGVEIWRYAYRNAFKDSFGFDNGPRACPTIAKGRVIIHGAEGLVQALDFVTGQPLWSFDTVKELRSPQGFFGRVCPPLVEDGKVILEAGGSNGKGGAGLVALNLSDGKLAWQALAQEASYAAPIVKKDAPFPALVCWMRDDLIVANLGDGSIKSQLRLRSEMDASVNAATPIWCGDDKLFTSACYDVGANLWQWKPEGKFTKIWHKDEVLDAHYSTPVYADGYLYGFHGRQEFGQSLRCIRVADGKLMWESGRVAGGTLLRVGETLLVLTESGELWLVDASPLKFNRRGQEQILRAGHRSHGAFSNGVFFARDDRSLVAVDLRAKSE